MSALRVPMPSPSGEAVRTAPPLRALTLDARSADALSRATLAAELRDGQPPGALLLETCHRVELYTAGPLAVLPARSPAPLPSGVRVLEGPTAVRHLLRVAAGLESAVIGEDQILAQLRAATGSLGDATDPVLARLVQVALGVGRRVRNDRHPRERGLSTRALSWIGARLQGWDGARILVAGAGDMGTAVALAAAHRGARVTVATRRPRRLPAGMTAVSLARGAALAPDADGIVVALAGPWADLESVAGPLPPIADLSSPPAVTASVRARADLVDIDHLVDRDRPGMLADAAFLRRAEATIDAAEAAFLGWVAARPSAPVAMRLAARGSRRAELRADAALRRLPGLDARERAIVRRLAAQVAADLLHEPLSRLGRDEDGRARDASRTLFDL